MPKNGTKTGKMGNQKRPALDTVAGVAVRRWLISKTSLMVGFRGIRSLLARVSTYETERVYLHTACVDISEKDRVPFTQSKPGLCHLLSSALFTILSITHTHTVTYFLIHRVQIVYYSLASVMSQSRFLFISACSFSEQQTV